MHKLLFIVWKSYQRRAEVLAPLIESEVLFIPHIFRKKKFRPIDYFFKLLTGAYVACRQKPELIVAQSPPLYSVLTAWLFRIPYIIDAHNPVFQHTGGKISWGKLPLSNFLIKNAHAVIVHNHGISKLAKHEYPSVNFFVIPDPIETIQISNCKRLRNQILAICSFDPDEPVETLLESIERLPDYNFVITADPSKLKKELQLKIQKLSNVHLTGFLPVQKYHTLLCSSAAALVLTNQDLIQPSGGCEALSSDTQLIISNTPLIRDMFGEWAILVDNSVTSIVRAVKEIKPLNIDLCEYRDNWNKAVREEIKRLVDFI